MRPETSPKTHNSITSHHHQQPTPLPRSVTSGASLTAPRSEDRQALAGVCRSAVRRWFTRPDVVGMLTATAVAQYAARPRRPAALFGHHALPAMRLGVWHRLAQLVQHRAELEFGRTRPGPKPKGSTTGTGTAAPSPAQIQVRAARDAGAEWRRAFTTRPVQQMIKFLGGHALADGRIDNVGRMIACYRKVVGCSEATAYAHWRTVRELGLVRQTRHSAGHRPATQDGTSTRHARYVLCWPPAMLPEHLPVQSTGWAAGPLADAASAWDEDGAARLADDDELGLVRYGSCRDAETPPPVAARRRSTDSDPHRPDERLVDNLGRRALYYLEACPLYARVPPPSPLTLSEPAEHRRPRHRPGRLTDDNRAAARAIVSQCRSRWAQQGHDAVNEDELAQLNGMIALVLRYSAHLGPGDLVAYLTERVRSAADLVAVLRHRLQRLINSLRHRANVRVDEQRADHARAQAAAEAAVRSSQTASIRAQARAQVEAARRRADAKHGPGRRAQRPTVKHTPACEPEEAFARELAARGIADPLRDRARFTASEAEAVHWAGYNTRAHGDRRRVPPPPRLYATVAELDHLPHRQRGSG